ncbi:MAG: flagellar hook-basal body complex protein [Planctomycetota bacterium]
MSSFISALSGLRSNQSWIDVIGNNLANANTQGFKSSRALFSDLLSITQRPGTQPTGNLGGTNPLQVGLGVQFASVEKNLTQGALNLTGRTFDLAMLGSGYFAVSNGVETNYTRVGSFGLDAEGNMVDQRTGYRVLNSAGQSFQIDTGAVFPPQATSQVDFNGNLPAAVEGPLAEVLTSSTPLNEGTAAITTGTNTGPFNVPVGETWTMELTINGGAPEEVSIVGSGSITAQQVADEINTQTDHVTATVVGGAIQLESDKSGTGSTILVNPGAAALDLKSMIGLVDFVQGTETLGTEASDLNALSSNLADYSVGDTITLSGTDVDGSAVQGSFEYGTDGTTVGDLVAFIDGLYGQATAAFNATTGQIELTADGTGEADLTLSLLDGASQNGSTDWTQHTFAVTTNGTGPDTVTTSVEVYDTAGTSHVLTTTFTRQDDGSWNLNVELPDDDGTIVEGAVTGITFNEDGSIQTPTSAELVIQFGTLAQQTMTLDLGTAGQFAGLTQFGNPASVVSDFQDGYGAGELVSMSVDSTGAIEGFFTNGQTQVLGDFGVATFANELGLEDLGDNYMRESPNSGTRVLGQGQLAGAGDVVGGALEDSNVDTAEQFVHLIRAQRGFQANARVVTVQDELLAEIVNVV